jgi:colanic acid/amylovoran biosynthesis glycosyltransferase
MLSVCYLINQYPKISHTFIRREIQAVEQHGVRVFRVAVRGWDAEIVDGDDQLERDKTTFILSGGLSGLIAASLRVGVRRPRRVLRALGTALVMGFRSTRPLVNLVYLMEACVLVGMLERKGIRHIHAHFGTNSTDVAMLACIIEDLTFSFTVHGQEEFDRPQALSLRQKVAAARHVVCISTYGRAQLYRWSDRRDWPKISVVHCGIDDTLADDPASPPSASRTILCVARLSSEKGHFLLVDAAERLRRERSDFRIVFAGDGDLRGEIQTRIDAAGLSDIITITGWIDGDEVRRQLFAARALVVPSFLEGLPVVIMEAMAASRPVLTTWVAGIPELVRQGEEGILFPPGSVDAIIDALRTCLNLPDDRLLAMGRSGRARVMERHSVREGAQRMVRIFEQRPETAAP